LDALNKNPSSGGNNFNDLAKSQLTTFPALLARKATYAVLLVKFLVFSASGFK